MRALLCLGVILSIGTGVITNLIGKDAVSAYFSKVCKEIQDLDYKIAEALHFIEDGNTIFANMRSYNEKVRDVTKYVDGYYDLFTKYENLVLERGPKRWFPVHFIEELFEERFNWTQAEFKMLNELFKSSENIYLSIKTKCKKWRERSDGPTKLWEH